MSSTIAQQITQSPPGTAPVTNVPACSGDLAYLNNHANPTQNPCLVAAYLLSACNLTNPFHVDSLGGSGGYSIPGNDPTYGGLPVNRCTCSSVTYMSLAGCVVCQGSNAYPPWNVTHPVPNVTLPAWSTACDAGETQLQSFPLQILPQGIAIPAWAFMAPIEKGGPGDYGPGFDLPTVRENATNSNQPPDVVAPVAPPSTDPPASSPSQTVGLKPAGGSHSHTSVGAIVGGVIGGLAALALGVIAIWFIMRRTASRKPQSDRTSFVTPVTDSSWVAGHGPAPRYESGSWATSAPALRGAASPVPSSQLMSPANPPITKLYDPDDPSTFPPRLGG